MPPSRASIPVPASRAGLAQAVRGSAKLAALTDPDPRQARAAHEAAVGRALAALTALGPSPEPEEWTPPACGAEVRAPRQGERLAYPHDLREGEHGFQVEFCSAAVLLEILPPGARIISVDTAAAMQAAGRRALPDPRVSWITARAEDAARHVSEPTDAVVCNSAIWKTDTPPSSPPSSSRSAPAAGSSSTSAGPSPAFPQARSRARARP